MAQILWQPKLFGKTKHGDIKQWQIGTYQNLQEAHAIIVTQYGRLGGAIQTTKKKVRGKNTGKANETTPIQQAAKQATSMWKKQHDNLYRAAIEELNEIPFLPMLAHKFEDKRNKLKYPVLAQPKLNGIRCSAKKINFSTIEYRSRKGKTFNTLEHFTPYLCACMEVDEKVDGEIYNHGLSLQEIKGRVSRELGDRSEFNDSPVFFYIYDIVKHDVPFQTRFSELTERVVEATSQLSEGINPLVIVPTFEIQTENEVKTMHDKFVQQGYEGLMVRTKYGVYLDFYRSDDLLKYKEFFDEEFIIVGGKEGQGKDEGTIIFECVTDEGKHFHVRPKGSHALRTKWYNELEQIIGKPLTVRYQDKSDDNIPTMVRGITIRDYE